MQGQAPMWSRHRVLVTGCEGFLGAAVTRELLDRQAHVIGLMREKNAGKIFANEYHSGLFHIAHGRMDDASRLYSILAIHEISAIFHLGEDSTDVKSAGTNRRADDPAGAAILQAVTLHRTHLPVVFAKPSTQLRLLNSHSGIPHGIARFGELFGPGDRNISRAVPNTITALLAGKRVASQDDITRDFVFVRDAARACLSLGEAIEGGSETLDVTFRSGWELTGSAMASSLNDSLTGRNSQLSNHQSPDNPLGWQPAMIFDDTIRETVAWYREHANEFAATLSLTEQRKAA